MVEKPASTDQHGPKAARVGASNKQMDSIGQPLAMQAPIQQKRGPPFIPSLKVGGLGFSTIVKENGKT